MPPGGDSKQSNHPGTAGVLKFWFWYPLLFLAFRLLFHPLGFGESSRDIAGERAGTLSASTRCAASEFMPLVIFGFCSF
ncbi:MAG: hypothetical protein KatS3mg111_3832 [Pirellulaceae bacterium]|nr:MAG: hypothetical protein KatS3mg111_3832 [Pirellulaceae bacterium]